MITKKIFIKKKINNNIIKFIIITILIFLVFFYYFLLREREIFYIPVFIDSFYIIPDDRGGKKIENQDKKGLHLSYKDYENIDFINNPTLEYSIQLYTHNNYTFINDKREELLYLNESIYFPTDLYIAVLKNDLGVEYFLLYKNFANRKIALQHCIKYAFFLDKCLIVNVKNLD